MVILVRQVGIVSSAAQVSPRLPAIPLLVAVRTLLERAALHLLLVLLAVVVALAVQPALRAAMVAAAGAVLEEQAVVALAVALAQPMSKEQVAMPQTIMAW